MATGVYEAKKKDGTRYFRANIHYRAKHISLGSFAAFESANAVYMQARELLDDADATLPEAFSNYEKIPFEKTKSKGREIGKILLLSDSNNIFRMANLVKAHLPLHRLSQVYL